MIDTLPSLAAQQKIASYLAKVAVRSLYKEVAFYPKPGLVSFVDSGAHSDMDGALFFRSLLGLRHYFYQVSLSSIEGKTPSELALLGRQAEADMFVLTQGVNTHKGAIFALGILCASSAKLISEQSSPLSLKTLQLAIEKDWSTYLQHQHMASEDSNGEKVRKKHQLPGAKAMAIQGYKPIFDVFEELSSIADPECYGLLAFRALLLCIDDTNVVYRTGLEGLQFARAQVKKRIFLQDKQTMIAEGIKLHHEFSEKNISPGGVADMLSVLYFLQQVVESQ